MIEYFEDQHIDRARPDDPDWTVEPGDDRSFRRFLLAVALLIILAVLYHVSFPVGLQRFWQGVGV